MSLSILPFGPIANGYLHGTLAKWDAAKGWHDKDGMPLPPVVYVIGFTTCLRKWKDQRAEIISEHPLPNPDELNAKIPQSEWEPGYGGVGLAPPWKLTVIVWFVHVDSGAVFTWVSDTWGAQKAYGALVEQVIVRKPSSAQRRAGAAGRAAKQAPVGNQELRDEVATVLRRHRVACPGRR